MFVFFFLPTAFSFQILKYKRTLAYTCLNRTNRTQSGSSFMAILVFLLTINFTISLCLTHMSHPQPEDF